MWDESLDLTSRDCEIESLRCEETLSLEKVPVVAVEEITHQLAG
jgi:hypothetical protein